MNETELTILNLIQTLRTPVLDSLMRQITALGDHGFIWILLTALLLLRKSTRNAGLLMLLALLFDMVLCNVILKPLVGRTRPCDLNPAVQLLIARPQDASFPSGHTAASFAAAMSLYFAGNRYWRGALLLAILIAFSRMYLYVHYPTDVLGGIAVGVLCARLAVSLHKRIWPAADRFPASAAHSEDAEGPDLSNDPGASGTSDRSV